MGDLDLRFLSDPALIGTVVAVLAFGYMVLIGSKTIPEFLEQRRKNIAQKSKQPAISQPDAALAVAVSPEEPTGEVLYSSDQRITTVSCSTDGECIAFGGFSSRVSVLSLDKRQIEEAEAHAGIVRCVRFGHSNHAIASAGDDGIVKISDLSRKEVKLVGSHDGPVYCISFHPNQETIASAGKDGAIRLWSLTRAPIYRFGSAARQATNLPVVALQNDRGTVFAVDFNRSGNILASGGLDGSVLLWDLKTKTPRALSGFEDTVFSVCFHPSAEYLAASGADGVVRIWDLNNNTCRTLMGHSDTARWLTFDPSGRLLVSASKDRTLRVWEFDSERCRVLDGHQDYVYSVACHPSGQKMFSVAGDGTVRAWSLPTFGHE